MAMRIGHGYDVHKLVPERPLILAGVTVPYDLGLLGHSDADVLVHGVMDSILGALALGDIGRHFPDTDPAYKGANSMAMLARCVSMMEQLGYGLVNLDATIIAQAPKLAAFLPEMCRKLCATLHAEPDCVNIKATTEEGLGFTGSGEGIAVHCVCLLEKK